MFIKNILILCLVHFAKASFSQTKDFGFQLRLPIQLDLQKAVIPFSYGDEVQHTTAVNFGADALLNYNTVKFHLYSGAGYFRNRFNIKRGYDHQSLNMGRDSFPIGTKTKNYAYSLFRVPLGISVEVLGWKKMNINAGAEHFFNFSFRRKYHGGVPFEGANTVYHGFTYFGNSLNVFINLSNHLQKNKIEVEPFVRIYNKYKKDRFLKENESEAVTRYLDAFGVGIKYSLLFK